MHPACQRSVDMIVNIDSFVLDLYLLHYVTLWYSLFAFNQNFAVIYNKIISDIVYGGVILVFPHSHCLIIVNLPSFLIDTSN